MSKCRVHDGSLRTLPRNHQSLRQRSRRDGRLDRSRGDTARIERRAARVCELIAGTRKDRARSDRRRANEIGVLDCAEALAGCEGEAAAGWCCGEAGAGAADVPCAGADDATVCCSAGGDLEGSFAGEGGPGCGGGTGGGGSGGGSGSG